MDSNPREKSPAAERRNYYTVQALRALAAGLVELNHSISMWLAWIMRQPQAP